MPMPGGKFGSAFFWACISSSVSRATAGSTPVPVAAFDFAGTVEVVADVLAEEEGCVGAAGAEELVAAWFFSARTRRAMSPSDWVCCA